MTTTPFQKAVLIAAGLIAAAIGVGLITIPVAFYASNGIALPDSASMYSETRAPGGALVASGILMVLGAFVSRLSFTALVMSSVLYLAYGVTRVVSMAIDGPPAPNLLIAMAGELIVGAICVIALRSAPAPRARPSAIS